jgi:rod shape-determining protein MreD
MKNGAFVAIGILLLLLQGSLYRLLGLFHVNGITPSLVLPLVIFLGVHEHAMARGALLSAGLGYALDLLASAPIGLFTFVSVAIWWLSRIAGVRLTAQTALPRMSLAFGFSLVESAIILTLLAIFGSDTRRPIEIGNIVLPHAISTALFAPFVFKLAQRLYQSSAPVHPAPETPAT